VNGLGGSVPRACGGTVPGSQICSMADNGAMLVEAAACYMTFTFVTQAGEVIDTYTLLGSCQL
jgi:hypothetical protein